MTQTSSRDRWAHYVPCSYPIPPCCHPHPSPLTRLRDAMIHITTLEICFDQAGVVESAVNGLKQDLEEQSEALETLKNDVALHDNKRQELEEQLSTLKTRCDSSAG